MSSCPKFYFPGRVLGAAKCRPCSDICRKGLPDFIRCTQYDACLEWLKDRSGKDASAGVGNASTHTDIVLPVCIVFTIVIAVTIIVVVLNRYNRLPWKKNRSIPLPADVGRATGSSGSTEATSEGDTTVLKGRVETDVRYPVMVEEGRSLLTGVLVRGLEEEGPAKPADLPRMERD